jgi:hypothetical protein
LEKASASLNTGLDNLGHVILNYARNQIEETVQTAQSLMNCRSFEEMKAVQSRFMQQSFDRIMDEANKSAQKAARMARDKAQSIKPLSTKIEEFVQRMKPAT